VRELTALADRIRADLTRLGDVDTLAGLVAEASNLERAARGEMDAVEALPAQSECERSAVALERDGALERLQDAWAELDRAEARANAARRCGNVHAFGRRGGVEA
jgi:hypothetical protein